MYKQQLTAYQDNEVLSAPPERLVPLLYEGLLKNLRRAVKQMRARDIEGKADSVQKASAIVFELVGSLDFERGGDLAGRLAGLYAYFAREITEASRLLDEARMEAVIDMVADLHEAWDQAARQLAGNRAGA